jgi:hypothetical protein
MENTEMGAIDSIPTKRELTNDGLTGRIIASAHSIFSVFRDLRSR